VVSSAVVAGVGVVLILGTAPELSAMTPLWLAPVAATHVAMGAGMVAAGTWGGVRFAVYAGSGCGR
jgi:hypothetical protein